MKKKLNGHSFHDHSSTPSSTPHGAEKNNTQKKKRVHPDIISGIQFLTGKSKKYISHVINGRAHNPQIEALYELSQRDYLAFHKMVELKKSNLN